MFLSICCAFHTRFITKTNKLLLLEQLKQLVQCSLYSVHISKPIAGKNIAKELQFHISQMGYDFDINASKKFDFKFFLEFSFRVAMYTTAQNEFP